MKTQLSKPARSKASYTDEYKQQALELWRASGRSAAEESAVRILHIARGATHCKKANALSHGGSHPLRLKRQFA
jgi:hypothetical protein